MSLLLALTSAGGPVNYADSLLAGAYTISGKSITDSVARADALSTGAYAIAGKSITDIVSHNDSLSKGLYSIAGNAVTDSVNRADNLNAGAYAISGKDITDVITTAGTAYTDSLLAGSYSITGYDLNDQITSAVQAFATPGFKLTPKFRGETKEEKRLRRESQGIIARAKVAEKEQETQLFDDAKDVVDQLKLEIGRLEVKAREFEVQFRHAEMIRAQLAKEQLEAQVEEIDTAFVVFMMLALE